MSKFWILRTLRRLNFLKNRRIDFELEVNDKKFVVPLISEIGIDNHKVNEIWMLDLFKKINPSADDILLDVGANTGQTLLKWKGVNSAAPYYGFEPMPKCIEYLEDLIAINNFDNTVLIDKALFSSEGDKVLYYHKKDETDRTASLVETHRTSHDSETVQAITFNKFLEKYPLKKENIKVIKIDVEGAELEVLQELSKFIKTQQPIVIIEILAYSSKADKARLKATSDFIKSFPHEFYRIKHKKNDHYNGLKSIEEVAYPIPKGQSDYILIPPGLKIFD